IAGLAFSLALAPFHLWFPPALEATPWPVVALMAGVAPLALLSASARLVFVAFGDLNDMWQPVLAALGLFSVAVGAIAGLATERVSHLFAAFATIGAGFGVMALSAGNVAGVAAMLAFMALQGAAMLGLIAFAALVEKDGRAVENLRDLNGYAATQMSRAFAVLVILLSAAAIPPLAGFVVRLSILQAMHDSGMIWQSLAGVGAMVLAGFAFLRPAWRLYVTTEPAEVETRPARLRDAIVTGSAAVAVLGLLSLGGMEAVIEAAAARLER
ncbi:MAG: proton-conducting transporter membrane subunit, partial [Pseudomonadota bacterium]